MGERFYSAGLKILIEFGGRVCDIIREITIFQSMYLKISIIFLISSILVVSFDPCAAQKTHQSFYVNNTGSDQNKGSKDNPFQSIGKLNSIPLSAGDTVFFQAGQTFYGSLLIDSSISGSKDHPIVITSYGDGHAIINGKDSTGITFYKNNFIKLQHLSLIGSGRKTGNVKDGLKVISCKQIVTRDIDISGFQKSGCLLFASQYVIVDSVFVHDNGAAGITVEGPFQKRESRNIQILNCRAENNPGDPTKLDNHSGNGIIVGNCKNVLIDHCTATNNGWDMPRIGNGPVGIWAYEADSVTIQHCLSYRNKTSKGAADGGGFDFDGGVTHSVIQYCFSYENEGSGYDIFQYWGASTWHDNIYRYNISENDGTVSDSQAGLYVWNSSGDEKQFYNCWVYGNVIYNSKVAAISFSTTSKSRNFHFYNNIFVGKDTLIHGKDETGNVVYEGNDWWSLADGFNMYGIKDIKTWANQTGKEKRNGKIVGLNEDPKFKAPGNSTLTSASQLKSFYNYQLPSNSELRKKLNLNKPGWF
ncbi:MAG TPA: right-handed parallel beta-helix repeat-containing protein [Chitinophagaceae bacterium]